MFAERLLPALFPEVAIERHDSVIVTVLMIASDVGGPSPSGGASAMIFFALSMPEVTLPNRAYWFGRLPPPEPVTMKNCESNVPSGSVAFLAAATEPSG